MGYSYNSDSLSQSKDLFPPAIQIIIIIIIIAGLLFFLRMLLKDALTAIFSKKKSIPVTLISKSAVPYVGKKVFVTGNNAYGGVDAGVAEKGMDYFFTFQPENGKMITLTGPKELYDVALEEGTGILTYKGKTLISYDGPTEGTRMHNDTLQYDFVGLNKKL